jgi:hypothetical protein
LSESLSINNVSNKILSESLSINSVSNNIFERVFTSLSISTVLCRIRETTLTYDCITFSFMYNYNAGVVAS